MKQLLILFFALFVFTAFNASAQCPTPGLAVVEVCNDTGGNGTIRVYTTDGGVPTSFLLFSISLNQFVSVPIGSVPVNTSIPLPPGAIAGVEFTLVPDDDYVVRINCLGGGFVVVGGGGINVNSANALILSKTPDFNLVCPTDTNGAGMFTASSGSPPYTFTLDANTTGGSTSSTPTTFSFNGAGFGLVTVTVTDNRNCTVQETINVIAPPYSFSTGKSDVSCFGGNDGSITVTVSGGTAPYEFSSNNGVSFSPPSASPFTFNTLTAGGYSIVVRDANLCLTSPTLVTINEPPIISITGSSSTNVSCNGGSDGSVTVTGAGGTGTLTYTLNPGAVMNTTGIFSGLAANTYTVSITDVNTCGPIVTPNILVTEPAAISITGTSSTDITCNGAGDGSITVTAMGGTGTLTYTLNPGAVSNITGIFTGLSANTYTVSIDDANACGPVTTANILITDPALISITGTGSTNVSCNAGSDGSITVTAVGGTGAITYTLNPGAVSNGTGLFAGLAANTYTVSVTDANACGPVSTANIVVTEPLAISITGSSSTNITCNGAGDGTITVTGSGGTGALSYTLNPGAINNATGIFTGLAANTYTVSITDVNLCGPTVTPNIMISEPAVISITGTSSTNVSCSSGSDGSITVTGAGGTGTLTYTLNPGAISNTTGIFSGLAANTYTVSITDDNACGPVVTPNIPITQPAAINITGTSSTNASCNAGSDGSIMVTAAGGTGVLLYTLNPGAVTNATGIFPGLAANTYTVSITDVNLCGPVVTGNIVITEPTAISITGTSSVNVSCNGGSDGSITVTGSGGTGPLSYTLNPGAVTNATGIFPGLSANTYTVSIDDVNLCGPVTTANIIITEPAVISITGNSSTNVSCNGGSDGSITVTGSGGTGPLSYTLNPGAVTNATGIFPGLSANTYTVSIDDVNSCGPVTTANILITEPAVISITGSGSTNVTCNAGSDGSITITGAGGTGTLTYTLNPGAVSNITGLFTGLPANIYTVAITDANACGPVTTANIIITEPSAISITGTNSTNVTCNAGSDGSITVTGTGGTGIITYTLNPGAVSNITGIFSGLAANTYTVSIDDAVACGPAVTGNIVITEPAALSISGTSSTNVSCNGGSDGTITVIGAGGTGTLTYTLNPGAISNTTGLFTGLAINTYTVSIDDANACGPVTTANIVISQPTAVMITSVNKTDATCLGLNNGAIQINSSGGTGIHQYSIDNGANFQASNTFINLVPGVYNAVAQDANGCLTPPTVVTINNGTPISITSFTSNNATCVGINNGSIVINTVTGGATPYQYSINGGTSFQASNSFPGLAVGSYDVVARDVNSCLSNNITIVIVSNTTITFTATPNDATCLGVNDGSIVISGELGGTGPYTYSIDNGAAFQASPTFTGLAAASFDVIIRDVATCLSATSTVVVGSGATITPTTVNVTDASCGGVNDGAIDVAVVTGGTAPYTYSIDNGTNFQAAAVFSGLIAAPYDVVVRDVNGCLSTPQPFIVAPGISVSATITSTDATCIGNDGSIVISGETGGAGPYTYSINNGVSFQAGATFNGLLPGVYEVVIREASGCLSLPVSTSIALPPMCGGVNCGAFTVSVIPTRPTCIAPDSGSLIFSISGGSPNYTLTLTNGGSFTQALIGSGPTFTFTNLSADNYSYTIADNATNTCTQPFSLQVLTILSASLVSSTDVQCFGQASGTATVDIISGGTSPYEYSLDGTNWVSFVSPVQITNLSASVTPQTIMLRDDAADVCPALVQVLISGPANLLDTLYVNTSISVPDLPNGTMTVGILESLEEPYEVTLELTQPMFPGQSFFMDWTTTARNAQLDMELVINGLYAGGYVLQIRDALGCVKSYPISIGVDTNLFIPNIFTPNGDGVNDLFYIRNLPSDANLVITNRWGNEVFSASAYQNDWDGGTTADGVYYFRVSFADQAYTGWVEIMRGK